ncbi:copper-binding transcription factor [Microbotryomycetes sp. JL201]|nr:copper-binding transcription factor [Microbotryomycetes sp. JL201]
MVFVEGIKFSCQPCIKGHRSANCVHPDRPLYEKKDGQRPNAANVNKSEWPPMGTPAAIAPRRMQLVLPYGVPKDGMLAQFQAALARNGTMSSNVSSAASSASAGSRSRANSDAPQAASVDRRQSISVSSKQRKESNASSKPHDLSHGHLLHSHLSHTFSPYPHHASHSRSAPMTRSPSVGSSSRVPANDSSFVVNVVPPPAAQQPAQIHLELPPPPATFELPPLAGFASIPPNEYDQQMSLPSELGPWPPVNGTTSSLPPQLPRSNSVAWSANSSEVDVPSWLAAASGSISGGSDSALGLDGSSRNSPVSNLPATDASLSQSVPVSGGSNVDDGVNPFDALASLNLTAEIDKWRQDFESAGAASFDVDGTGPSGWTSAYEEDDGDHQDVSPSGMPSLASGDVVTSKSSVSAFAGSGSDSGDYSFPAFDGPPPPPVLNAYDYPRSMWPWLDDAFLSSSSSSSRAASSVAESDYSDYAASVENLPALLDSEPTDALTRHQPSSLYAQHLQQTQQHLEQQQQQQQQLDIAAALNHSLAEFDLSLDRTDTLVAPKPGQQTSQFNSNDGYDEDDEYDSADEDDDNGFEPRSNDGNKAGRRKKKSVMKRFFSSFTT